MKILPWTIPLSKWHKLATGIWLGGSWDNSNIYVKYVDESAKGNRQCRDAGASHTYRSHTHVTPCDVYPFCLSPILGR